MSIRGPKEKKERSLGERLQLKGERCLSLKCVMVRRPYRPGVHGNKRQRRNLSDFGRQLKEKQKFKVVYGLNERNLRTLFTQAAKARGDVAAKILELLERRVDNVVYRLGFTPSRGSARQAVLHGHILINGKRTRSPAYLVKASDIVSIHADSLPLGAFRELKATLAKKETPTWLRLDVEKLEGQVMEVPARLEAPFEINLLVESFSK